MAEVTDWDFVYSYDAKETMEYVNIHGVSKLETYLEEKMNRWRFIPVKIGIIGEAGVGKSSFINALMNVSADDPGAAPVGTNETTTTPTPYPHPFNPYIQFWDLPGVGTPRYPQDIYLEIIDVKLFDFFLILSDRRFTQLDAWFCRELIKIKKDFFFVRTKFDEALQDGASEVDVRQKIQSDVRKNLMALNAEEYPIYLLSNFETDNYDFPKLLEDILKSLPSAKKQAMILSLGNISRQVIEAKKEQLKSRLWMSALISGAAGAVPVPGIDLAVDLGILLVHTNFMLKQFGLDDESLENLAQRTGTTADYYKHALVKSKDILLSKDGIASGLKAVVLRKAAEEAPEKFIKFIPFVGLAINAGLSFGTTYFFLSSLLNDFEIDARAVLEKVIERQVTQASAV